MGDKPELLKSLLQVAGAAATPGDPRTALESARPALSAPMPKEAVQRSQGSQTGLGYDTTGFGYQWIVDRLNAVLGLSGWRCGATYEVEEYQTQKGRDMYAVTAAVRLELGYVDTAGQWIMLAVRDCFGGHDAKTLADAKKGALTNGMKKTAAMFGVGAEAFRDEIDDDVRPRAEEERGRASKPQAKPQAQVHPGDGQQTKPGPKPKLPDKREPLKSQSEKDAESIVMPPRDPARDAAKKKVIELAQKYGSERCARITEGMPRVTIDDFMAMAARIEVAVSISDDAPPERTYSVDDYYGLKAAAAMNDSEMTADLRSTYGVAEPGDLDQVSLNNACRRLELVVRMPNNDVPV